MSCQNEPHKFATYDTKLTYTYLYINILIYCNFLKYEVEPEQRNAIPTTVQKSIQIKFHLSFNNKYAPTI